MKRHLLWVAVVGVLAGVWATAASSADKNDVTKVMRLKLDHAQACLEGLALDDFKKVANNAASLIALTGQAEWRAYDRPEYLAFSMEFRRAVEQMQQAAARRNGDGVAMGYVAMTMACVNCHKVVRDIQKVDAGGGAFDLAAR